ncbi:UTP--glucose-1-phosphate uridylyltransferase [Desulfotomaculum arcticum]|uniref:UTP--glucose-1-phosphate uridylyltransferase n=1 Tax=Desulfotruncus arcticus DSM 17038 TaxID=1121424 RepID=A0A1I2T9L2_9FIRM|nr:UTP--glucose-1-phosphate uridylyltransferase [Desulfotomaculum arcticum] [Desulfotruncus arcticus DSM 17038]
MYAYNFEGKRYDVGNKQGFLEATVEAALRREDLRGEFLEYLVKVVVRETGGALREVAATEEK